MNNKPKINVFFLKKVLIVVILKLLYLLKKIKFNMNVRSVC